MEPTNNADGMNEHCPLCGGALIEKKLKRFCSICGQLCETCCDGGNSCDF